MKRTLTFLVLAAGVVLAQRGGGGMRGGGSSVPGGLATPSHGFGSIMFPGGYPRNTLPAGPVVSPSIDTSFGRALGAPYGRGAAGANGMRGGGMRGGGYRSGGVIYAPFPVVVGGGGYGYGGYGYDYYPEPQAQPAVYQQQPQPLMVPQQAPTVIINQHFQPDRVNPQVRDYSNADLPPTTLAPSAPTTSASAMKRDRDEDKPTIYLLALKDGSILATLSTWVEGDTLNYITRDSNHNRISLDRVDQDFSVRLNAERGLEMRFR